MSKYIQLLIRIIIMIMRILTLQLIYLFQTANIIYNQCNLIHV